LLPSDLGVGREDVGAHEVDLVGLTVPFAVQHRDHVEPAPHVRTDVDVDQAELFGELAPQRVDRVFVRLDAAAGEGPHDGRREVESGEQHAVGRIEQHRPHATADPQVGPCGVQRRILVTSLT
jgi:hypothetical protein